MEAEIAIVGVAETAPARRAETGLRGLVIEAVLAALADAGIEAGEGDGIVTDSLIMPATVPHDYVSGQLGIQRRFDAAISYGGAGIVAAPLLAEAAIRSGQASVVVVYFGVDWGTRADGPYGFHDLYPAKLAFEKPYGFNGQPAYFALWARRYMHEFGADERHLAAVAVAQRRHAIVNGRAQAMRPLTEADYFQARLIADPLRVPDCCLISDGAGAYVLTSAARARDCAKRPVQVLGAGFAAGPETGDDVFTQHADLLSFPAAAEAAEAACRRAGIGLEAVDFAEIYDCFSISVLLQLEDLGFCAKGEAGPFVAEGHTGLGGRLPVNTHGGLLSYSYRLGIEHVVEAVHQLRGEAGRAQVAGAEIGLVGGLSIPDYGVLLLGRG